MNKLYVYEMSKAQLKKVFTANAKIRELSSQWAYDDIMDYAHDILSCFPKGSIDWCVGYDRGCFVTALDSYAFMVGVEKMQEEYGFITTDEMKEMIEETISLMQIIDELNFINYKSDKLDTAYELCVDALERMTKEIADHMHKIFIDIFKDVICNEEYQIDMWFEMGYDTFSNCYIDADADDYILYRDVTETFN